MSAHESYVVVQGRPDSEYVMVPNAFARCSHIAAGPARVLVWMASHTTSWKVYIDKMAKALGHDRKTVSGWIDKAAETPYLDVAATGGFNRHGHPTYVYYVDLTKPCEQCMATASEVHGEKLPVAHGEKFPTREDQVKNTNSLSPSKQASRAREPHVIPDDWRPNRTHQKTADRYQIDLNDVLDEFYISDQVHDRERRSDWDRTFGKFLNLYADGRHEDVF